MLNRRFTPYFLTVGILALLSASYVGYREYQNHVEFEHFMSSAMVFQQSLEKDIPSGVELINWQTTQREGGSAASSTRGLDTNQMRLSNTHREDVSKKTVKVKLMLPEKVARYSHGDPNGAVVIRSSPSPFPPVNRTWTADDMVMQLLELPNGTIVEARVPSGMEIREGDEVSPKYIAIHTPPENTVEIDGVEHKIPPNVDRHQHLQKLFWSHELGVSVEAADRMIANRELIVKPEGESMTAKEEGIMFRLLRKIPKFDSFLRSERPDLYEAEHDHLHQFPSESRKIAPGDSSSYPQQSPWEDSEPIPQGKGEKQAPVPSEPPSVSSQETGSHEGVSPDRFDRAQQLIDQYGSEEGLHRLREMDPEAARRFESDKSRLGRERQPSEPTRDTSDDAASTQ